MGRGVLRPSLRGQNAKLQLPERHLVRGDRPLPKPLLPHRGRRSGEDGVAQLPRLSGAHTRQTLRGHGRTTELFCQGNGRLRARQRQTAHGMGRRFHEKNPQPLLYTFWRDWKADQVGEMTQRGLPVIFMEWGHFYLSANPTDELLKELYNFTFQPRFKGIVRQNIKGYQACVWTEMIPNETKLGQHL